MRAYTGVGTGGMSVNYKTPIKLSNYQTKKYTHGM